jgi:hypothetical protein
LRQAFTVGGQAITSYGGEKNWNVFHRAGNWMSASAIFPPKLTADGDRNSIVLKT